jgi:F-type H+-transporting ATPase subunit a
LITLVIIVGVFGLSVVGGALGAPFGLGFLGAPIAAIQLPAERVAPAIDLGVIEYEVKNTAIMFWIAGVILVLVAFFGTRKIRSNSPEKDVPTGLQNFLEVIVGFFITLGESAAGGRHGRRFLPLVLSIFLVVVVNNWIGVLPGVGTIGWVETSEEFVEHRDHAISLDGSDADFKDPDLIVFEGDGNFKWIWFGQTSQDAVPLATISEAHEGESDGGDHADEGSGEATFILDTSRVPGGLDKDFNESLFETIGAETADTEHPELRELHDPENVGILVPYLRGANTDVNNTLAIALVAMITVQIWGFRSLGFRGYGGKFINLKQGPIYFFVGILEIIGELARTISFTFRLFGNMFAGEVLLVAMAFLFPLIGIIPFIGLELFVGVIQGFIFAMLTLVFGVMASLGHAEEEH